METVALDPAGRDVVGLPLPPFDAGRRPLLLGLDGAMSPDDEAADPIARLAAAAAGADRLATVAAAFRDELVAAAYREGAAEYAARLDHLAPAARREWGARGMLSELAAVLRLPEGTLAKRLARQTALGAFPAFQEANAAGLVSSWHCDVMLDVFGAVDDEAALAAADAALIDRALVATAAELRVTARRWRARHVPRTEAERRRNLADRCVEVSPADDDLCWFTALLPAAQAVAVYHKLSDVAAKVREGGDDRTAAQLRADVLVDLVLSPAAIAGVSGADETGEAVGVGAGTGTGGRPWVPAWVYGIKPVVVLTVPVLSMLGHSEEPAILEGVGPIDMATAKQLAAQAPSFVRVLTHPETGAVLSVGRDRYRVPADLRTALTVRDGTCRFPGCRRSAARCDADHSTAWGDGGGTGLCNLALLCRKHHRLKHELGWTVTHVGGGVLTWTSPAGVVHRTEPATRVWPPPPRPPDDETEATDDEPPPVPPTREITSGYPDEPPF